MKNMIKAILLFAIFQVTAQDDIKTTVLKGDQLITYAADNFPSDKSQQIYILVETGTKGIALESKFYIEKGISLLAKRLQEGDQIAIGAYGAANGTVLTYTDVGSLDLIFEKVESLFKGTFAISQADGIDLAYKLAETHHQDQAVNTVVMLRGTRSVLKDTKVMKQKNAYSNVDLATQDSSQSKGETASKQREQAKAASHTKLGGAIALTALTILPELLDIIKD